MSRPVHFERKKMTCRPGPLRSDRRRAGRPQQRLYLPPKKYSAALRLIRIGVIEPYNRVCPPCQAVFSVHLNLNSLYPQSLPVLHTQIKLSKNADSLPSSR